MANGSEITYLNTSPLRATKQVKISGARWAMAATTRSIYLLIHPVLSGYVGRNQLELKILELDGIHRRRIGHYIFSEEFLDRERTMLKMSHTTKKTFKCDEIYSMALYSTEDKIFLTNHLEKDILCIYINNRRSHIF